MKFGLDKYRAIVLSGLGLLVLAFGIMVTNLFSQLQDLSTAASDNQPWSISQLDAEFANLNTVISDQLVDRELSESEIQLRIDIALSRLYILNTGSVSDLLKNDPEVQALLQPLNQFAQEAILMSDRAAPLTDSDLRSLRDKLKEVRPNVRKLTLLGLRFGAERAQNRRTLFSDQLKRTGVIAIVLLIISGALLMILDLLLRRAALRDAELLRSSRQLASTVSASLDAIIISDQTGKILDFNEAAEEVFGWTRDEILGQAMEHTIIPPRLRDAHHNGMNRYTKTREQRVIDKGRVELVALRKSGEEFPIELNITSVEDEDGIKFIGYLRDISQRKITEQTLIDARDRAERTDRAKSQFLAIMSHEMRTPLNGILGVLDLLRTTKLTARQDRYAQIATASSEILLEQINEALDITRIETGTLKLGPQVFDLPEMIKSLIDVLEPLAKEKDLKLSLDIEDGMRMSFFGDNNRIRQILTNLIGNAIKFTERGSIKLAVTGIHGPVVSSLTFAVTDTGAGIPAESQEQVFEDFVALAHGEGRQTRGDGLGLSISRKIARQMGGDIRLNSVVGQGSTFALTVPLKRGDIPENPPETVEANAVVEKKQCDILVVEDNLINRKVLGDMLVAMGHSIQEATNGQECLDLAGKAHFDIIFMDISMPIMDGIEATRRLRASDGMNAKTQIIGLTAHGREEYREEAELAGMNRFHTKPIRLDALHSIVSEVSSKTNHEPVAFTSPDALRELIQVLGRDKVSNIADRFFRELGKFIDDFDEGKFDDDPATLWTVSHMIKGAAAMLGQVDLEAALNDLETPSGRVSIDEKITTLKETARQANLTVKEALTPS